MTPDVAAVVITAITLPYADKWISAALAHRKAEHAADRKHELAKGGEAK